MPPLEYHQAVLGWQEKQPQFISTWHSQFSGRRGPVLLTLSDKGKKNLFTSPFLNEENVTMTGNWGWRRADRNHLNKQSLNRICYENFFHKQVCVLVAQLCATLCNPMDLQPLQPARLLCPWEFSRQQYWGILR